MKTYILLFFCFLLLTACGEDKATLLTGKWQEVTLDKPNVDNVVINQQKFVDTFGRHGTAAQNMATYGYTNMDSARAVLQLQVDSMKMFKQFYITNTQYEFRQDRIAYARSVEGVDSANWYILDNGKTLLLDDSKLKGEGVKTRMEIMMLTRDTLRLRFAEDEDTSTATFIPIKK